jgi:hypothetical protein
MNKREVLRQYTQEQTLQSLGFTLTESQSLRRISMTLHRWAEHECNGTIERDENRADRPYWSNPGTGQHFVAPVADREAGAMKRLRAIFARHHDRQTPSWPDGRGGSSGHRYTNEGQTMTRITIFSNETISIDGRFTGYRVPTNTDRNSRGATLGQRGRAARRPGGRDNYAAHPLRAKLSRLCTAVWRRELQQI